MDNRHTAPNPSVGRGEVNIPFEDLRVAIARDPGLFNEQTQMAGSLEVHEPVNHIQSFLSQAGELPSDFKQLLSEGKEVLGEMKRDGSDEFRVASPIQKAGLGATAITLALEWGTFNEGIIGVVGGKVLNETHNALLAAGVAGGVSVAEQSIFGLTMVYSIRNFPRAIRAGRIKISSIASRYEDKEGIENTQAESDINSTNDTETSVATPEPAYNRILGRTATAFSIGSSLATVKNNAIKELDTGENAKNVLIDSGLIGISVVGLAGVVSETTNLGRSIGLESEANLLIDVFSNPLTYAGLFGIHGFRKWRQRKNNRQQPKTNGNAR
jgi:hypothetical protein